MKFCTSCGTQVEDGVRFCTNCGAPVETAEKAETVSQPIVANELPTYEKTAVNTRNTASQNQAVGSAFGTAIAGIILCTSGLPGWIVSGISRKKCKAAIAAGAQGGKLKAANIISRIALPVSIIMTFIWVIYSIAIAVAVSSAY